MSDYVFEFKQVSLGYPGTEILRKANLGIPNTGVSCLVGPSGQGKSTVLRTLNRLNDRLDGFYLTGSVLFNGRSLYDPGLDVMALRQKIGFIMQRPVMFHCSIRDNVLFGLKPHGKKARRDSDQVVELALRDVGLFDEVKDRLNGAASTLSVGQQQRLAIARALVIQPQVLMMDEPTSALDAAAQGEIEALILSLKDRMPILVVTHQRDQVNRIADRVIKIHNQSLVVEVLPASIRSKTPRFTTPTVPISQTD